MKKYAFLLVVACWFVSCRKEKQEPTIPQSANNQRTSHQHVAKKQIQVLISSLKSSDINIQKEAIKGLSSYGREARKAIPFLLAFRHHKNHQLRYLAVKAMASLGFERDEQRQHFLLFLEDSSWSVIYTTLAALQKMRFPSRQEKQFKKQLLHLASHSAWLVRKQVVVIAQSRYPATPWLFHLLETRYWQEKDNYVWHKIATAFLVLSKRQQLRFVETLLEHAPTRTGKAQQQQLILFAKKVRLSKFSGEKLRKWKQKMTQSKRK